MMTAVVADSWPIRGRSFVERPCRGTSCRGTCRRVGVMRFGICNETFGDRPHERVCADVAAMGYQGLELAPFTLGQSPRQITAERRRQIASAIDSAGLTTIGLHWLLAKTTGLPRHRRRRRDAGPGGPVPDRLGEALRRSKRVGDGARQSPTAIAGRGRECRNGPRPGGGGCSRPCFRSSNRPVSRWRWNRSGRRRPTSSTRPSRRRRWPIGLAPTG